MTQRVLPPPKVYHRVVQTTRRDQGTAAQVKTWGNTGQYGAKRENGIWHMLGRWCALTHEGEGRGREGGGKGEGGVGSIQYIRIYGSNTIGSHWSHWGSQPSERHNSLHCTQCPPLCSHVVYYVIYVIYYVIYYIQVLTTPWSLHISNFTGGVTRPPKLTCRGTCGPCQRKRDG